MKVKSEERKAKSEEAPAAGWEEECPARPHHPLTRIHRPQRGPDSGRAEHFDPSHFDSSCFDPSCFDPSCFDPSYFD